MTEHITLTQIRDAAKMLADARRELEIRAKLQEEAIEAAVAPIIERHRAGLEAAADLQAEASTALFRLLSAAPSLFPAGRRSIKVDTISAGYRKAEDTLDWPDDQTLIDRIADVCPEMFPTLVRTEHSLVMDALTQLDAPLQRRLGIRRITGADNPYITYTDGDIGRMVKALLADYAKRADEAPKPKKGKVKARATA